MAKLKLEDYTGAIAILENYLDGAVADYEQGQIENTELIWSSIKTIELLYSLTEPLLLLGGNKYRERMEKVK